MNVPFNGFANAISVQAETTFNASSAATIYALIGKIKFTQAQNFGGKTSSVGIFRQANATSFSTSFWNGSIEMDFGFNAVTKLMLASFFELASTTSVTGGFTKYVFRPIRLQALPSFKIGLSYNPAGQNWSYSGVVIDSLTMDFRRNQLPKLTIQFKAASANFAAGGNPLGTPVVTVAGNVSNHTKISATLNAAALANITEYNFVSAHAKEATGFGASGLASRFGLNAPFTFKGQVAEYFNAGSLFPTAVQDQTDRAFTFQILDPLGTAIAFSINWPRVNFNDGMPDGIGSGDLVYRANFDGLQDDGLDVTNEASFILVC